MEKIGSAGNLLTVPSTAKGKCIGKYDCKVFNGNNVCCVLFSLWCFILQVHVES